LGHTHHSFRQILMAQMLPDSLTHGKIKLSQKWVS
jgi:hypothetical protein